MMGVSEGVEGKERRVKAGVGVWRSCWVSGRGERVRRGC